jgi:hypothetical protein
MAGDLSGLVRMLAPRVRATEELQIRVVLHVITPPTMDPWPRVVVCLTDGRMSLPELTLTDPDAHARATPRVWLESLLSGEFDAIAVEGEATAAHAVLAGLAAVLRPRTTGSGANERAGIVIPGCAVMCLSASTARFPPPFGRPRRVVDARFAIGATAAATTPDWLPRGRPGPRRPALCGR